MSEVLISIDKLRKRYPAAAEYSLKGISLEIMEGERFGILGPNGAGKTTLISILCHILPYSEGTVNYYHNGKVLEFADIRKHIGFVPQDLALYEDLTAFQNVEYFAALYNLSAAKIKSQASYLFDLMGLSGVAHKKVKTFSGGMKRRLNLIVGIVHDPKVIFLDEPTVGVDIQSRNAILDFLDSLNKNGTTIIYTSHHLDEAERLCNRIAIIDYGSLLAVDSIENLLMGHKVDNLTQLLIKLTGREFRDNV